MKPLSRIAEQVNESSTLAMDALYKQMKADGIDVIGLRRRGAGFPHAGSHQGRRLSRPLSIMTPDTHLLPVRWCCERPSASG